MDDKTYLQILKESVPLHKTNVIQNLTENEIVDEICSQLTEDASVGSIISKIRAAHKALPAAAIINMAARVISRMKNIDMQKATQMVSAAMH